MMMFGGEKYAGRRKEKGNFYAAFTRALTKYHPASPSSRPAWKMIDNEALRKLRKGRNGKPEAPP
jgi:hypothetical protein